MAFLSFLTSLFYVVLCLVMIVKIFLGREKVHKNKEKSYKFTQGRVKY